MMTVTTTIDPAPTRTSVLNRLLRLRTEIERLAEVGFDPWRYSPALRREGDRGCDGRDVREDDRLAI